MIALLVRRYKTRNFIFNEVSGLGDKNDKTALINWNFIQIKHFKINNDIIKDTYTEVISIVSHSW